MNVTVARIVDIMFQDTVMDDEAQALHDEILRNCQDRFDDLIAQGRTEDEAIAVVIDSLKGMDDVIKQCPKKPADAESYTYDATDTGDADDADIFTLPASSIHRIQTDVRSLDITFLPTEGEEIRIDRADIPDTALTISKHGETLMIHSERSSSISGWLSGIFSSLGDNGDVKVYLPAAYSIALDAHSLSGNITASDVAFSKVSIVTTSGDVELMFDIDIPMNDVNIQTASGDLRLDLSCADAMLRTMSGDISYDGTCQHLTAASVSGDIHLNGQFRSTTFSSVSGDVTLTAEGDALSEIHASSTSGDIKLFLHGTPCPAHLDFSTVSGDIHNSIPDSGASSPLLIQAKTVSGDIRAKAQFA